MITKGKKLEVQDVMFALTELVNGKVSDEYQLEQAAINLVGLNDAMLSGCSVFAVCEKNPPSLDKGCHYYSVYFVQENRVHQVWLYEFSKYVGGTEIKNSNKSLPHWCWKSGAIGMSRVLDATDGLFSFLRRIGGCYDQINCL